MAELPPWFNKDRERRNARSRKQEKERAEEIGGRTQAGSGSSWRAPEDIRAEGFLEQLKFTDSKGFRVTVDEWKRIKKNANNAGRLPRMVIEFSEYGITLVITELE